MVQIKEYQHDKCNHNNCQERFVEYSSWNEYLKDIQAFDGMKNNPYPTLPRQTKIDEDSVRIGEDYITFTFYHKILHRTIYHESTLIKK